MRKQKVYLFLETLEERCTPAGGSTGNVWTDALGTKQWSDAGNWSLFHVPKSSEIATFAGTGYSSDDCNWSGGQSPGGLAIVTQGFTGTITLSAPMEVLSDMTMNGGNIAQPAAGDTLTVDGAFNWTAGILNTTGVLSTVFLQGGNLGGVAQTVGSTLDISGSVSYSTSGSMNFNNNAGVNIRSTGTWNWGSTQGNLVTDGTGAITNNGGFNVNLGTGATASSQLIYQGTGGGAFTLSSGTLNFPTQGWRIGYYVQQDSGRILISSGATLGAGGLGLHLTGGSLQTSGRTYANINGNVVIDGGEVDMNAAVNDTCGALQITGNLTVNAGIWSVKADPINNAIDTVFVTGSISLANAATLSVNTINLNGQRVPTGRELTFMGTGAGGSITGNFGTRLLAYNDGSGKSWGWTIDNSNPLAGATYTLNS
jgi:hypothetical protein